MKKILLINIQLIIVCFIFLIFSVQKNYKQINSMNLSKMNSSYQLAWPGMLPDNKLYKSKVLRNKIISKMILDPIDRVRFDLLMADKTIYASKLLVNKGEIDLAKDSALKGEYYYGTLAQDYNSALLKNKKIPEILDQQITFAAQNHQEVFKELEAKVAQEDKKSFAAAENFSKINFNFVNGLRNPKVNK